MYFFAKIVKINIYTTLILLNLFILSPDALAHFGQIPYFCQ